MTDPAALRAALAALHARHRERHAFVAATAPTYPPIACDPTRCPERDYLDLLDAYDAALTDAVPRYVPPAQNPFLEPIPGKPGGYVRRREPRP